MKTAIEIAAPIVACLPLLVLFAIELHINKPVDDSTEGDQ